MRKPNRAQATELPSTGQQPIPRVGDVYTFQNNGLIRDLEVTCVEWDDDDRTLTVTMKPFLTHDVELANPERVTVQDTNPYKHNPGGVVYYDANSHKQFSPKEDSHGMSLTEKLQAEAGQ